MNLCFLKAHQNAVYNVEVPIPKMPINFDSLFVTMHLKNMAEENTNEVDWKLFRELSCGCAMQKKKPYIHFMAGNNNKNNIKQQLAFRCPHKKLVTICPTYGKLKAQQTAQLAITLRYDVLGQHKITYSLV